MHDGITIREIMKKNKIVSLVDIKNMVGPRRISLAISLTGSIFLIQQHMHG